MCSITAEINSDTDSDMHSDVLEFEKKVYFIGLCTFVLFTTVLHLNVCFFMFFTDF